MAKYLLSYDEADVKDGRLDVSPDGVLRSAGKSGSDEPVLPQKVLFCSNDSDGNILCCGRKASEMTMEEGLALCLSKMPYLMGEEDWFATAVKITNPGTAEKALFVAGVRITDGSSVSNTTADTIMYVIKKDCFKQS